MAAKEWSLVLFTLLTQASIGLLAVSEIARCMASDSAKKRFAGHAMLALALSALGLLLSLTHLGAPSHAVYAIFNLGASWLSREILFTGLYFFSLLLLTIRRRKAPNSTSGLLSIGTLLLGVAALIAMSNVYRLETAPAWNTYATLLCFLGAALLTGAGLGALLHVLHEHPANGDSANASLPVVASIAAALGLTLQIVSVFWGLAANAHSVHGETAFMWSADGLGMQAVRLALVFLGVSCIALSMNGARRALAPRLLTPLSVCALVCVMAGEVIGRVLFYGSYFRVGL
jgi:anaerobic dimethyl sulfoxide reductase subunit C (anchor subunit)